LPRYYLKKATNGKRKTEKANLLSEGWFTDLAVAFTAGGPAAIKDIVANKLKALTQKAGEIEDGQALDMVKRFQKMGLKNIGGQNLGIVEKAILQQQRKRKDAGGRGKEAKIDLAKLTKLLTGEVNESATPWAGASLRSVFLSD